MIRCSTVGGKGLCKIMIHYNKKHAKDEPKKFNILIDSKKSNNNENEYIHI